mmetsp:Transcript_12850/g.34193  ORF Transcript_12850/g.34193 Transcript_12850/m.34193 type:complete len:201 (+) Transcript_12850:477-1079(+)
MEFTCSFGADIGMDLLEVALGSTEVPALSAPPLNWLNFFERAKLRSRFCCRCCKRLLVEAKADEGKAAPWSEPGPLSSLLLLLLLLPLPRKHNLSLLPVEVLILGVLPCALRLRSCCPCGGRGLHGSLTLLFLNLLLKRAQLLGCTLFPLQLLLILLLQGAGGRGRASWRWGHSCCPIPFARGLIFGSSSSFAPCSLFIC